MTLPRFALMTRFYLRKASYYSQIEPSFSKTDRQVTLRSLTAFFFDRFAIWERWGISSPKPLAWGPVPRPLLRFALIFDTIHV